MTPSDKSQASDRVVSPQRRQLIQMTIAGAGLMLSTRSVSIGVAPSFSLDARLHQVQPDASLLDATALCGEAGLHQLRVVAGYSQSVFSLEAVYAENARHRFWQTWRENDQMYQSSPCTLRWIANADSGLPIAVSADGGSVMIHVPAIAGSYVLALGMQGEVPAVQNFVLREATEDRPATRLVGRRSGIGATFPHVILAVAPLSA
jgi:hypothetical protein